MSNKSNMVAVAAVILAVVLVGIGIFYYGNSTAVQKSVGSIAVSTSDIKAAFGDAKNNIPAIAKNVDAIKANTDKIVLNTGNTADNTETTADNTEVIKANTGAIKDNTGVIKANTGAIKNSVAHHAKCKKGPKVSIKKVATKGIAANAAERKWKSAPISQPTAPPSQTQASIQTTSQTTSAPAKSCSAMVAIVPDLSVPEKQCVAAVKLMKLGKGCFTVKQIATLDSISSGCEVNSNHGFRKVVNQFWRLGREITGWNGFQRAEGTDLHNGWEQNKGGDYANGVYNAGRLYFSAGIATKLIAKNVPGDVGEFSTKICDNIFKMCNYNETFGNGSQANTGGGGNDTSHLTGPGSADGVHDSTTTIPRDTPISNMTPVNGIGGDGVYGTSHPITNGMGSSGDNTMPSNLGSNGSSTGMTATKVSEKFLDGTVDF